MASLYDGWKEKAEQDAVDKWIANETVKKQPIIIDGDSPKKNDNLNAWGFWQGYDTQWAEGMSVEGKDSYRLSLIRRELLNSYTGKTTEFSKETRTFNKPVPTRYHTIHETELENLRQAGQIPKDLILAPGRGAQYPALYPKLPEPLLQYTTSEVNNLQELLSKHKRFCYPRLAKQIMKKDGEEPSINSKRGKIAQKPSMLGPGRYTLPVVWTSIKHKEFPSITRFGARAQHKYSRDYFIDQSKPPPMPKAEPGGRDNLLITAMLKGV